MFYILITFGKETWRVASMVTILRICALHLTQVPHTQQWVVNKHHHTMNTHPEQWAAIYAAAPGEQLGVRCPCSRAPQSWYWGGESAVHSLPPPTIPCRTWDSNPRPLGYKSDSLSIRPRLPHITLYNVHVAFLIYLFYCSFFCHISFT